MNSSANLLQVYKDLAECYTRRGQAQMRDRFLVLAADAALSGGQTEEAERLRERLLQVNPHHMIKPYATFSQAREAPDVDTYVRNLRLNYPLEVAADLLRALQASDDPNVKQLQQTAPIPARDFDERPTLELDDAKDQTASTGWNASDDDREGTLALPSPAAPPSRPVRRTNDGADTLPTAPRPRVPAPTKAEPEPIARPSVPRAAPRSAAPAPPPRAAAPSRPAVPKAPPRPAPGPSPFASFPNEAVPSATARRPPAEDDPPDSSGWLASVLVVLVGLLGIGVAAWTFARPFLPKGWLP